MTLIPAQPAPAQPAPVAEQPLAPLAPVAPVASDDTAWQLKPEVAGADETFWPEWKREQVGPKYQGSWKDWKLSISKARPDRMLKPNWLDCSVGKL